MRTSEAQGYHLSAPPKRRDPLYLTQRRNSGGSTPNVRLSSPNRPTSQRIRAERPPGRCLRRDDAAVICSQLIRTALERRRSNQGNFQLHRMRQRMLLGLIESADASIAMRRLRNRMIHEYVKQASDLTDALTDGRTRTHPGADRVIERDQRTAARRAPSGKPLPDNA